MQSSVPSEERWKEGSSFKLSYFNLFCQCQILFPIVKNPQHELSKIPNTSVTSFMNVPGVTLLVVPFNAGDFSQSRLIDTQPPPPTVAVVSDAPSCTGLARLEAMSASTALYRYKTSSC